MFLRSAWLVPEISARLRMVERRRPESAFDKLWVQLLALVIGWSGSRLESKAAYPERGIPLNWVRDASRRRSRV